MKKNEFRIDVTEKKMEQMLEYLNDMQRLVDSNRNNNNHDGFVSAMHYRDGFIRALTILGVDYDYEIEKIADDKYKCKFTRIKKDIYAD